MSGQRQVRRRQFLGLGVAVTVAGSAVGCGGSRWRFFSDREARTAEAICEQIIPADQDAGARDAGVVNYIDLQLTRHFKASQPVYRQGLAAVDAAAAKRFGKSFADLSFAQQTDVLREIEKSAKPFFDLIVAHTMQGFYGDPRHGGNREAVSWKMLRVPPLPIRGRVRSSKVTG